ncbi:MAG: outer membrane protein assembly factor BamE [Proteobacteria bacterium]|nr:outer membrane protein assembly factor BamE [Pseudomonadota bacterium]MCL2307407.1 outer membrane protein assembly factor BamE [Pseudomonadota bacterium]
MKQLPLSFTLLMRTCGVALFFCLAGCSTMNTYLPDVRQLGVYKLDINQGNYLTQDMVEKLKVGQTRQQVRTALGTPLMASAFHADRWDYVYSYTKNGKEIERRQFVVFFKDDQLERWEGDDAPVSQIELNRIAGTRTLPGDPSAYDEGFFTRMLRWFGDEK